MPACPPAHVRVGMRTRIAWDSVTVDDRVAGCPLAACACNPTLMLFSGRGPSQTVSEMWYCDGYL